VLQGGAQVGASLVELHLRVPVGGIAELASDSIFVVLAAASEQGHQQKEAEEPHPLVLVAAQGVHILREVAVGEAFHTHVEGRVKVEILSVVGAALSIVRRDVGVITSVFQETWVKADSLVVVGGTITSMQTSSADGAALLSECDTCDSLAKHFLLIIII
jgi:hypothetical protein